MLARRRFMSGSAVWRCRPRPMPLAQPTRRYPPGAGEPFSRQATAEVNQQKLFPRVAAVIHHGGAGTTFAAARAGTPQLIVPQVADQFYWAERVAELGIGVAHNGSVPSSSSLAAGLESALEHSVIERAGTMAGRLRTDAAAIAAQMLVANSA
jgi:vancomycin aglycone glucosyltransferase